MSKTSENVGIGIIVLIGIVVIYYVINTFRDTDHLYQKADEQCHPFQLEALTHKGDTKDIIVVCATEDGGFVVKQLR